MIQTLEDKLTILQKEMAEINTVLSNPSIYEANNKIQLQTALLSQAKLKKELAINEEAWLKAHDEQDSF